MTAPADQSRMDAIVSLAKRRGFIFPSSEIYGGLNGFWDYGPLGVELKRNLKNAWWHDMVTGHDELATPSGAPGPYEMTGLDCTIIMHPQAWRCSGHFDLFHDWLIDCRESKRRYRYDHLLGRWAGYRGRRVFVLTDASGEEGLTATAAKAQKFFGLRAKQAGEIEWEGDLVPLAGHASREEALAPEASEPAIVGNTISSSFHTMSVARPWKSCPLARLAMFSSSRIGWQISGKSSYSSRFVRRCFLIADSRRVAALREQANSMTNR